MLSHDAFPCATLGSPPQSQWVTWVHHERANCVIYADGTIGMMPAADGYRPAAGLGGRIADEFPRLLGADMPRFELVAFDELIDSANACPEHRNAIAEAIIQRYDDFDGFVVLQVTDTLAYTATALSFMIFGLAEPVITTGSLIPRAPLA